MGGKKVQHRTNINKIWFFKPVIFTRLTPVQEDKPKSQRISIYVEVYKQKLSLR